MNRRVRNILIYLLCLPPALMMLISAIPHIVNNYFFLSSIYSYRIFGQWTAVVLAAVLPFLQLSIGFALLFVPSIRFIALFWSTLLFLCFIVIQIMAKVRGLNIDCGCFGASENSVIGMKSIGIAVIGFVSSAVGCLLSKRHMTSVDLGNSIKK